MKKPGKVADNSTSKSRSSKAVRPFPHFTVERAAKVAQVIKDHNGGNPWAPGQVANAIQMTSKSSTFYYVTAAARDYGFTQGTRDTDTIELTALGKEIVYAPDAETELKKKREAFLKIPIFKSVLEYYNGTNLPEMKYLGNTLEAKFNLSSEFHEEFSKLFRENCEDLSIESGGDLSEPRNESTFASGRINPITILVGEPKGPQEGKPKAFVIMPFVEREGGRTKGFFAEALRNLITPAAVNAGFRVETANRQGSDVIQSTIINELIEADLVIADLTDHNPNVLFELGVRLAQNKPVAIIKATDTGRIFDVDNMLRVFEYSPNLWISTVEKDLRQLQEHIQATWDTRDSHRSYMKILSQGLAIAA